MAGTGEAVSYRDYEARSNQLAHLLRSLGLRQFDHFSIYMENNDRYLESCSAGQRSGLIYTPVNSYLTAEELAYIIDNSESTALITSRSKRDVALEAADACARLTHVLVVDDDGTSGGPPELSTTRPRCPNSRHNTRTRRAMGLGDAVFVGHDGPAEGHHAPDRRPATGRPELAVLVPLRALAVPRGCRQHLARQKVLRSIDYIDELPRLPTGKLYKKALRDQYWGDGTSRIV